MKTKITHIIFLLVISGVAHSGLFTELLNQNSNKTIITKPKCSSTDECYFYEISDIGQEFGFNYDNPRLIPELKACSDKGNYYCSSMLGDLYYSKQKYSLAHKYLLKASDKIDGNHDFSLGYMFNNGLGVLLNQDKAIKFYKKAVKTGCSIAAYNLGLIYKQKSYPYDYTTINGIQSNKINLIRSYAWYKISLALGNKTYKTTYNTELPLLSLVEDARYDLRRRAYLAEADKLAIDICSGIKGCIQ